jgi:hypothetical protein
MRGSEMLTSAYKNFRFGILKTEEILRLGISGISSEKSRKTDFLEKIYTMTPEEASEETPRVVVHRSEGREALFQIRVTGEELEIVKMAVEQSVRMTDELVFHLHGILCVSIWGSFETYIQGLLKEIYTKHPDRLKSDRSMTIRQVVQRREDIIEFLIDQEIAHIGGLTLSELLKYIKSKVLYDFPEERQAMLRELYLVRNILAHNSGFVRYGQRDLVPSQIPVVKEQMQIPQSYLSSSVESVELAVDEIEKYVLRRWFDAEVDENDPYRSYARLKGIPVQRVDIQ